VPSGQVRAGAGQGWYPGHCDPEALHERSGQSTGAEAVHTTLAGQVAPASTHVPSGQREGQGAAAASAAPAATSRLQASTVRHSRPSHETVPKGQVGSVGHEAVLAAQDSSAGQRTSPAGHARATGHAAAVAAHWLLGHRAGLSAATHTTGVAHEARELAQAKLGHVTAGHETMGAHSLADRAQVPSVQRTIPAWHATWAPAVVGHTNPRLRGRHSSLPRLGQREQPAPLLAARVAARSAAESACQGTGSVSLYSHEHICGRSASQGLNTGHSVASARHTDAESSEPKITELQRYGSEGGHGQNLRSTTHWPSQHDRGRSAGHAWAAHSASLTTQPRKGAGHLNGNDDGHAQSEGRPTQREFQHLTGVAAGHEAVKNAETVEGYCTTWRAERTVAAGARAPCAVNPGTRHCDESCVHRRSGQRNGRSGGQGQKLLSLTQLPS
jgi:hypothetical protein